MKSATASSLLALSLASFAFADDLHARSIPGNNVVAIDFLKERAPTANNVALNRRRLERKTLMRRNGLTARDLSDLDKRAGTVLEPLENAQLLYYANVSLGTPAQSVRLQIDTGSSDVWVNSANSAFCSSRKKPCDQGTFDETASSTYQTQGAGLFNISYVDNSGASGDYFSDNFSIGNATLKNQIMGIANGASDIAAGIMGVGYDTNEAVLQYTDQPYSSLIDSLVSQGVINTKAYSLWLNDLSSNTGSVLFGGIDTKKYQGSLVGLPLQHSRATSAITDFAVALSGVSYTSASGQVSNVKMSSSLAVILDSGSTLMYLPDEILSKIAKGVGAGYNSDATEYLINCDVSGSSGVFVSVQFGGSSGPTINVPLDELVLPAVTTSGAQLTDYQGNPICTFGIQPSQDSDLLFGDTFLRSAYVVYDLDNDALYVAQTVFNQTDSDIREITGTAVPDVSGVASGATATITGTGIPRGTAKGTVTVTGAGTSATGTSKAAAPGVVHPMEFGYLFPMVTVFMCMMVGGGALLL